MRYKLKENRDQLAFSFKKRSWKNSMIVLSGLFLVFLFSVRAVFRVYQSFKTSSVDTKERQIELAKLEEREIFLSEELARMQTREGEEANLREKFGVGLPSENVAIIVSSEEDNIVTKVNFLQRIKDFFSKILH